MSPEDSFLRQDHSEDVFIDTGKAHYTDQEIKHRVSARSPYGKWNAENLVDFDKLVSSGTGSKAPQDIITSLKAFGYSREDLKVILKPMAQRQRTGGFYGQ